jgi:uncharacterized small protein (DUF1192 family)
MTIMAAPDNGETGEGLDMIEEDLPRPKRDYAIGQKLDELSLEDIEAAIALLKAEITRLETARTRKAGHMSAAEALFKPRN